MPLCRDGLITSVVDDWKADTPVAEDILEWTGCTIFVIEDLIAPRVIEDFLQASMSADFRRDMVSRDRPWSGETPPVPIMGG